MKRTSIYLAAVGGLCRARGPACPGAGQGRARQGQGGRRARRRCRAAGKELYPKVYFDFLLKERLAQGQPDTPELRNAIREELNTRELLVREAKKKGLDKNADVKNQMDLAAQTVLVRGLRRRLGQGESDSRRRRCARNTTRSRRRWATRNTRSGTSWSRRKTRRRTSSSQLQKGEKFEKLAERVEGPGLQGQRRRPRLERAGQLRQAVLRRDGQAAEGQVHRRSRCRRSSAGT